MNTDASASRNEQLKSALTACRSAILAAAMFSGVVNLLMLTGSIYMLQVYDRVLASQSVPTLIALSVIVAAAFAAQGVVDAVRMRLLARIGERVEAEIAPVIIDLSIEPSTGARSRDDVQQPMRDLEAVRAFIAGPGPTALFDLPWVPIYLAVVWLLHPWLVNGAVAGIAVLIVVTLIAELSSRRRLLAVMMVTSERNAVMENIARGAEAAKAMGMLPALASRCMALHGRVLSVSRATNDAAVNYGAFSKAWRFLIQSAILGLGAWIVVLGQMSPGAMIAASILVARALAPIDTAIGAWRGFTLARLSWKRLAEALLAMPHRPAAMTMPPPTQRLAVDGIAVVATDTQRVLVANARFTIEAGSAVAVIGPSGTGKTTLARAIMGIIPVARGGAELDEVRVESMSPEARAKHIGYLPQDIQIYDGTVRENIARFQETSDDAAIVDAAKRAGLHSLILDMKEGYHTRIGRGALQLSAGERQRLGLARALYGTPFLLVLDEPNANLDAEGEGVVARAVKDQRERGGIAVVIAHRPSVLSFVDKVLVMKGGAQVDFGPKDEVLRRSVSNAQDIQRRSGAPGGLSAVTAAAPTGTGAVGGV